MWWWLLWQTILPAQQLLEIKPRVAATPQTSRLHEFHQHLGQFSLHERSNVAIVVADRSANSKTHKCNHHSG